MFFLLGVFCISEHWPYHTLPPSELGLKHSLNTFLNVPPMDPKVAQRVIHSVVISILTAISRTHRLGPGLAHIFKWPPPPPTPPPSIWQPGRRLLECVLVCMWGGGRIYCALFKFRGTLEVTELSCKTQHKPFKKLMIDYLGKAHARPGAYPN